MSVAGVGKRIQAAVLEGPGRVVLQERPIPNLEPGQILVKVNRCLICATDLELIKTGFGIPFPIVPGHEWTGTVVEVGSAADAGLVGKRIVAENRVGCGTCDMCRIGRQNVCSQAVEVGFHLPGGYAEYLVTQAKCAIEVPDHVSFDEAVFTEPVAVCLYHMETVGVRPGERVLIIGPAQIGLLCAQIAKLMGAAQVVVTGTRAERLELARSLGADQVVNVREADPGDLVRGWPGGGADVVIETAGGANCAADAVRWARLGGRVGFVAGYGNEVKFPLGMAMGKNLAMFGTIASPGVWHRALALIASGRIAVKPLLTHRFVLSDVLEALEAVRERRDGLVKAVLDYGD